MEIVPEVPLSAFVENFVATFVDRFARFIGIAKKVATKMGIIMGLGEALDGPKPAMPPGVFLQSFEELRFAKIRPQG